MCNTSWMRCKCSGNPNLYATGPILSIMGNGPTYLRANFTFFPSVITPLIGDTRSNTCSPMLNSQNNHFASA